MDLQLSLQNHEKIREAFLDTVANIIGNYSKFMENQDIL